MKVRTTYSVFRGGDAEKRKAWDARVEGLLNDPPKGFFVQDVKFGTSISGSDWCFSCMVIYGEIPTT